MCGHVLEVLNLRESRDTEQVWNVLCMEPHVWVSFDLKTINFVPEILAKKVIKLEQRFGILKHVLQGVIPLAYCCL